MKHLSKTTSILSTGISSIGTALLFASNAFADISGPGYSHHYPGPAPYTPTTYDHYPTNVAPTINFGSITAYLLLTLLFELPIFYWLGLRSKKAMAWAVIVNLITVPAYQIMNVLMSGDLAHGPGLVIAEILITVLEASILVLFLPEIKTKKIVIATVAANLCSAVLGTFIVNYLFGGIS